MAIGSYVTIFFANVALLARMGVVSFTFAFVAFVRFNFASSTFIGLVFFFAFVTLVI